MNKADLVNLVAARTELTKTDVSMVVDAAIETLSLIHTPDPTRKKATP